MAKSLEVVFQEAVRVMTAAQKEKFYQKREEMRKAAGSMPSLEAQINLVESIATPKQRAAVRRNNGAGTPLSESEIAELSRGSAGMTSISEGDRILYKALNLSEAEIRKVCKLPPAEVEQMSEKAQNAYRFGRGIGLSESDAIRLAKKEEV